MLTLGALVAASCLCDYFQVVSVACCAYLGEVTASRGVPLSVGSVGRPPPYHPAVHLLRHQISNVAASNTGFFKPTSSGEERKQI